MSLTPLSLDELKNERILSIEILSENKTTETALMTYFTTHYSNQLNIQAGGYHYIEIFNKKVNKGYALKKICRHFHIAQKNTLVVGDSETDIAMFEEAGYSLAMSNGSERCRKAANFITKYSNDNDGAIQSVLDIIKS